MRKKKPKPKGLAAISLKRRREIASMGGKAVQAPRAFAADKSLASRAGIAGAISRRATAAAAKAKQEESDDGA